MKVKTAHLFRSLREVECFSILVRSSRSLEDFTPCVLVSSLHSSLYVLNK